MKAKVTFWIRMKYFTYTLQRNRGSFPGHLTCALLCHCCDSHYLQMSSCFGAQQEQPCRLVAQTRVKLIQMKFYSEIIERESVLTWVYPSWGFNERADACLPLSQFSMAMAACDGLWYLTYPKPLLSPVVLFFMITQYSMSPYSYKQKKKNYLYWSAILRAAGV